VPWLKGDGESNLARFLIYIVIRYSQMNAFLNFMKRNYKIVAIVVLLAGALFSFTLLPTQQKENDPERDKVLLELLT